MKSESTRRFSTQVVGIPVSEFYSDNAIIFGRALKYQKTVKESLEIADFDVYRIQEAYAIGINEVLAGLKEFCKETLDQDFVEFLENKFSSQSV